MSICCNENLFCVKISLVIGKKPITNVIYQLVLPIISVIAKRLVLSKLFFYNIRDHFIRIILIILN